MNFILVTLLLLTSNSFALASFSTTNEINFYLFTPKNPHKHVKVTKETTLLRENPQVVFLIHGWRESWREPWFKQLKNAILQRSGNTSVIEVDWSKMASKFYLFAAAYTVETGETVGAFIYKLVQNYNISTQNIHLYGHSLGAHVAGSAGKYLQTKSLKLSRITALDPAGVLFQRFPLFEGFSLNSTDADVVVVLHTDTWILGCAENLGTVDIYLNGQPLLQPGCFDLTGYWLWCSHIRSYKYFVDALEHPGTLVATRCNSYDIFKKGGCRGNREVDLGGWFTNEDAGDYYLDTGLRKPYGLKWSIFL